MSSLVDKLIEAARAVQGSFALGREGLEAGSVGAALMTEGGNIYTGICIDLACGIGFCAEHAAIAEMLKHRETAIKMVVALSGAKILPPCGRCRELMLQIDPRNAETEVIVSQDQTVKLKDLLPYYWNN